MSPLQDVSITRKLTAMILGTVILVLAMGFLILATIDIRNFRRTMLEQKALVARVVGEYSVSDLAFDARLQSEKTLSRLGLDPSIESAALYDSDGKLFSTYTGPLVHHDDPAPVSVLDGPLGASARFGDRHVVIVEPIVFEGQHYGTLVLQASTEPLTAHVRTYLLTVLSIAAGLAALAIIFAVVLQRSISRPILHLAGIAEQISVHEDFSVRASMTGGVEFRILSDGFNSMLSAIEQRQEQRDIAEAAQRRYAERLRILHEIDEAILATQTVSATAQTALHGLMGLIEGTRARVLQFDEDVRAAETLATYSLLEGSVSCAEPISLEQQGPFVDALRQGDVHAVEDTRTLDEPPRLVVELAEAGVRSILSVPLYTANELVGLLQLGRDEPGDFEAETIEVAHEVAELLAVAIRQARLSAQIDRHTEELEHRVAERTAEAKQRAAELARSNAELEQFAYVASHDLQEPLRMVASYMQLLERRYKGELGEDADKFIYYAVDGAKRMQTLLNDLLTYSRAGRPGQPHEEVELGQVLDAALANLRGAIQESGATIDVGPLPRVTGNFGQLLQLLQNLVGNAIKYKGEAPPRIRIEATARGRHWVCSIEDNGIGIDHAHQSKIFQIFQRLHEREKYPGTGVGLAIVKRIVEQHGGEIWVESTPGEGSRFSFTLLRSESRTTDSPLDGVEDLPAPAPGPRLRPTPETRS